MLGLSLADLPWNIGESSAQNANVDTPEKREEMPTPQVYKQRGHAMAKLMSNSQDARLKHVEDLCAKHADAIARFGQDIQQSLYSAGAGDQSDILKMWDEVFRLKADVRQLQEWQADVSLLATDVRHLKDQEASLFGVANAIRRLEELQSMRVETIHSNEHRSDGDVDVSSTQLASLQGDIIELRAFVEKGFDALSEKHMTEVGDLKHNMQHLRDMQEYVAIKSGFLALAATDCSHSEKEALFSALQEKESKLNLQGDYSKSLNDSVSSPLLVLKDISGAVDEVAVTLNRSRGQQLGATVVPDVTGKTLLVDAISDGMLKEWSAANGAKQIRAGSKIVSVNGIRHDASRMMDELATSRALKILVNQASR